MNNTLNSTVRRLVIKLGSSTLTDTHGHLDSSYLDDVARQVNQLYQSGIEVLVVSSAAIVAGLEALGMPPARPDDIPTLQAAAAVGQVELSKHYAKAFGTYNIRLAQVLLTRHDIQNRQSYLHVRAALNQILAMGVVPLINENDTVAIDEIRFGDNDTLAAQLAILVKADLVVLLSDIEGLYTADPRLKDDAQLLEEVAAFTAEILHAASAAGTDKGSGGMFTKLEAAQMLKAASIPMVICEGHVPNVIINAAQGQLVGTHFLTDNQRRQAGARKLWLALAGNVRGTVTIDEGAEAALRERGGSLLPVGIKSIDGTFAQDSVVDIRNAEGLLLGRGLSSYTSEDLHSAIGLSSADLASTPLAQNKERFEVIHRDRMVIF
ncbi:MAG: glutamate 5-kinase [Coriobacteriales bacterium]|jgi:glutamate 5-kinase|nr:glutamate 5-kinase [Coriobacteriales bacterium]